MTKAELSELFTFRNVKEEEADQTIEIENICFPSNESMYAGIHGGAGITGTGNISGGG